LAQSAGLLEPVKALFNQASPAEANGIATLPGGYAVQVAAAALVVLGRMRCSSTEPLCQDLRRLGLTGKLGHSRQAVERLQKQLDGSFAKEIPAPGSCKNC
jgi:hypothetical protein